MRPSISDSRGVKLFSVLRICATASNVVSALTAFPGRAMPHPVVRFRLLSISKAENSNTNDITAAAIWSKSAESGIWASNPDAEPPKICPAIAAHVGQATTQAAGSVNVLVRYEHTPHMRRCT